MTQSRYYKPAGTVIKYTQEHSRFSPPDPPYPPRHDGLIILATNRPYDLDEAMHRRIMVAIEFRQPDHLLRKAIWATHMPEQMKLADDVDLVRS